MYLPITDFLKIGEDYVVGKMQKYVYLNGTNVHLDHQQALDLIWIILWIVWNWQSQTDSVKLNTAQKETTPLK